MDFTLACVWVGDRYGAEYPARLLDMVRRNLSPAHTPRFLCITDRPGELPEGIDPLPADPELPGWWQKVSLFKPGRLPVGRILYLDLDVAITGPLDELVERPGIIDDWHLPGYNSSVMVWDSGQHHDVWQRFTPAVMDRLRGDQDWITEVGVWPLLPADWCVSFRSHAMVWPPAQARVVVFHGDPKPHQLTGGWVAQVWKQGGLRSMPSKGAVNVGTESLIENMRIACALGLNVFNGAEPHERECCLVGSGPGLEGMAYEIRERQKNGAAVASMNGSLRWLLECGITPSSHIVLDARPGNIEFVRDVPRETTVLVASQCHHEVFRALSRHPFSKVILWHASIANIAQQEQVDAISADEPTLLVGGGSTVGLRAMYLAYLSGFRRLHLYGYDSCYTGDAHHAFPQPLNDGERVIEVMMGGETYRCSPWMAAQAQEFNGQHNELTRCGVRMEPHGPGLIPDICRILNGERSVKRYTYDIPNAIELARQAAGLCAQKRVAIQAGAARGEVPAELSRHFARVIAFEPNAENFEAARDTINGAPVKLIHAALGACDGLVSLTAPEGEKGNPGAWQTTTDITRAGGLVNVRRLDGMPLSCCDLLMLDIEGDELLALKGATRTIAEHKPVVVLEDKGLGRRHGHEAGAAAQWLVEHHGYREVMRTGRDVVLVHTEC